MHAIPPCGGRHRFTRAVAPVAFSTPHHHAPVLGAIGHDAWWIRCWAAAGLLAALAGCGAGGSEAAKAQVAASAVGPGLPVVELGPEDLITVQSGQAAEQGTLVSGSLQASRRADLRAETSGTVTEVLPDNGQPVAAGAVVVVLDDRVARSQLVAAEDALRTAQQAVDQARRLLERQRELHAQGMVSAQALEEVALRERSAQSELVAARAREAQARQQLASTRITAPFAGVVTERKVSVGDTVSPGRELLKVMDPASLRVEGLVSADQWPRLRPGQWALLQVQGQGAEPLRARLLRVDALAHPATRQVAVQLQFVDPEKAPRLAGLFVEGRLFTQEAGVLQLEASTLVRQGGQTEVWVVQGERLVRRTLTVGPRDDRTGAHAVLAGLQAGERVLRHPPEAASRWADRQVLRWRGGASAPGAGS
ncbi:efflux RND transporter periplasmic adaptor subunit [Ideonella livida]|uniref:Efflux RND transporter periplasmic adaptor subunit n=1 Tax=Ideonella livida TaxID=2707176 RepID=A0A7C9TIQ6_9BURK|nr:efflux RND transporter periplasmic adaptor subunit [Ideonella livida]NDY90604.1 efflux RND transporter periplasmic adaptor subunit [Ideonella livida]